MRSPPSRRRGLKCLIASGCRTAIHVASLAEAWIEIFFKRSIASYKPSPPSRRRGLKFAYCSAMFGDLPVASLAEAWIEIIGLYSRCSVASVASLAEAWIEMPSYRNHTGYEMSPPSRRRGLKSVILAG